MAAGKTGGCDYPLTVKSRPRLEHQAGPILIFDLTGG